MHISYIFKVIGSSTVNKNTAQSDNKLTAQLEAFPGTFREVGDVLIQAGTAALASVLAGEERVGSAAQGELFFTAAHGR